MFAISDLVCQIHNMHYLLLASMLQAHLRALLQSRSHVDISCYGCALLFSSLSVKQF